MHIMKFFSVYIELKFIFCIIILQEGGTFVSQITLLLQLVKKLKDQNQIKNMTNSFKVLKRER